MPIDIAEKFQQYLDDWSTGLITIIQTAFPDLSPEEQQDQPVIQSESFFAHCMFRAIVKNYLFDVSDNGLYYTVDIELRDNDILFGNQVYVGKDRNAWTDAAVESMNTAVFDNPPTSFTTETGDIYAFTGGNCEFKLYAGGVYDYSKVRFRMGADGSFTHKKSSNYFMVYLNELTYTIDENSVVYPNRDYNAMNPWGSNGFLSIKNYPIIGNVKDLTTINNFITKMGATNNYTNTYTTPDNKTITVYYGDNYIITHVNDDEPVSYNDVKNALNIAVNQINDDNDTDMNVPDYPVPPPPSPIESDNQEDGGNYNHAEFTKVYACTSAELNDLYNWMGGGAAGTSGTSPVTVPDSFDPMNRIVGLIGYPMIIDAGVGDQTTFTFRNAANQTINTGWSTYKYANFDRAFDFGTVTIPNWEELENGAPFLDYSATVEIYIPFCGIVGLDPQAVMGCTLSCKMWIDFVTGDCSAVVYTNYGGEDAQHPVAFVSGNCGSAEVVSANAFGAYQGAKAQASHKMSQAILGGFKDLATSVIGGATTGFTRGAANPTGTGGNAGMRAGAIGSVIGGAMNLGVNLTLQNMDNRYAVQVAKNALGTTISGSFGQQTSWYYMDTPYIKVTWPTPISKDVELYGKTFGVPVHRSGALNEFTGYTVCNNVDVSGIAGATASELAIIKQFLETGVFIKEGGGE